MRAAISFSRVACPVALALAFLSPATFAQDLTVDNYTLVERTRVSRVQFDFTYTAEARNNGSDLQNVSATLTSNSPHTIVVSGQLEFGDLASGGVSISQNTFTIRQDRRFNFSWADLEWHFSHDEVQGEAFWVGPGGGTFADSSGTLIIVPPGALEQNRLLSVQTHLDESTLSAPAPYLGGARFGPGGIAFQTPISVTFSLNDEFSPATELPLFSFKDDTGRWAASEFTAVVNPDRVSATAEITHFTDYIIMGERWDELFGEFERRFFDACNLADYDDLFNEFVANTQVHFPLHDKKIWDFSAHYSNFGRSCYEIGGYTFQMSASRATPDPVTGVWTMFDQTDPPLTKTVEIGGGYVSLNFQGSEVRRKSLSSQTCGDKEFQMAYTWDVDIHLAPGLPSSELIVNEHDGANDRKLCVGDSLGIEARLSCGAEPYSDVFVELDASVGAPLPFELVTGQDGVTSPTSVYEADDVGIVDLKGSFEPFNFIAGHAGDYFIDPVTVTVDACPYVTVDPPATDLFVGSDREFIATLKQADHVEMPGYSFSWRQSEPRVSLYATSPNSVVAEGVAPGPVTLTAETTLANGDTVDGTADIEVVPKDIRLEVSPEAACLTIGETIDMSATVYDQDDEIQPLLITHWTSNNENVVSIDPITGVATALADGFATITVTATTIGGAEISEIVRLSVSFASIEPRNYELGVHGGYQLTAVAYDKEDTDTPIATIGPYVIPYYEGVAGGPVFFPYADPDFYPYIEDPANGLYSDPDAAYKLITWMSGDTSVATVNQYGHVHGVSPGQAVISATLLPGSDVEEFACATVNVVEKPAINSRAEFFGDAENCYFNLKPGSTPHPFDFDITLARIPDSSLLTFRWGGGGNGISILPEGTSINSIEDPASFDFTHPLNTEFFLEPHFAILLWASEQFTSMTDCGGHRYAGIEHTGYVFISEEEPARPIYRWYLFENYLDVPEGFHLNGPPTRCIDDGCSAGATANPEWDPEPTPGWWIDLDWIWEAYIY